MVLASPKFGFFYR